MNRRDKLGVMAYMHFIAASGKGFVLNRRQYKDIAWALHDGQIAEDRLLSAQKETPYQRYRVKRLGAGHLTFATDYAITACRSSQKEMDRIDESSFARLDSVILALSKLPTPRGCIKLKWLLPDLRVIREADCVIVYAIDNEAKRLRILKVSDYSRNISRPPGKRTGVPKAAQSVASKPKPSETSPDGEPSRIDLDWQDGYSGQTVEELLSFERYGRTDLLVAAFTQAIQEKADRRGRLSEAERVILAVGKLDSTMVTDGYDNFFRYSAQFASTIVDALLLIGCKRIAKATQRALDALCLAKVGTAQVKAAMNRPDEKREENLSKCSASYWKASGPARQLFAFIKANQKISGSSLPLCGSQVSERPSQTTLEMRGGSPFASAEALSPIQP